MILSNYEPKRVLHHFEAISQIPRGSGNEKAVSDYIAAFAKGLGLTTLQDEYHNLVVYKPAAPGYEGQPPIILQGHLDMVCEKNTGTTHDFLADPLKLYVDGDYLKAEGTTLGADNGIAVAMCMALLEATSLAHPPIEVVLTSDEEAGMGGALNLDMNLLKGRRLINLDSSTEGTFVAGCASGATVEYELPAIFENPAGFTQFYKLAVKGLVGGHSGGDIHLERGNAIRILGNLLYVMDTAAEVRIISVAGGMKVNAIPREAEAIIAVKPADSDKIQKAFEEIAPDMKIFFRVADPGLDMTLAAAEPVEKILTGPCSKNLITSLVLLPNGVECMSREIEGLVAASSNIGVIETFADTIKISSMPRGKSNAHNYQTERKISALAELVGAKSSFTQRSPAWPFNPKSDLLAMLAARYKVKYGKDPKITAIHGGLECGIFGDKLPGMDTVSMGPDIHDLHTPDERLSISSTQRVWEFLCEALREMK
ncbi:MAG: aminoacyl-histidine dipeptidase [Defluviitaleaceae bacterium]|nr:aminoacyl-histidine dipeptidase [Defluviitaleaceae bacterium]